MARVTVDVVRLSTTAGTIHAGGSLDVANGAQFAPTRAHSLYVRVANSTATAGSVIVRSGDNPPAFRNGLGDLTLALGANSTIEFAVETARHMQGTGYINLDFVGAINGTIRVYELPRDAG